MQANVEVLDAYGARLSTQVAGARQEVAFAWDELVEARRDAAATREAARAVKDTTVTAADNAQDIDFLASFKVLH